MTKTVILEKMDFPEPVIKVAVEPKTKGDQQKMGEALVRLAAGESRHVTSLAIVMNSDGDVTSSEADRSHPRRLRVIQLVATAVTATIFE